MECKTKVMRNICSDTWRTPSPRCGTSDLGQMLFARRFERLFCESVVPRPFTPRAHFELLSDEPRIFLPNTF